MSQTCHINSRHWHRQIGDTHFVADSENTGAGPFLHATACWRRGSRTVNSVKSPTSLSTVIVPPCCWVMISELIDRPSPVPSPVGLVVKKGWRSFSQSARERPTPLYRSHIST